MDYPQLEYDYDVAVPQIQCNADKVDARIFLVPSMNAYQDEVRVLAFDDETAFYYGKKHSIERAISAYL